MTAKLSCEPSVMLAEFGKTFNEVRVAFVTCKVVVPTCPANTADIVEVPGATPVALPFVPPALLTVATEAAEEVQVTADVRSCVLPSPNVPMAVKLVEICCGTLRFVGKTDIEFNADDSTTMLTVPLTPPMEAVMVASPADCPVTEP